jgi:uncharacterized protein DUF5343
MASDTPPYMLSPGTIANGLEKIKNAATPERFTQDFLGNTLGMKGGTPKPLVTFLKRIGFLGSDGTPTELYKRFRNPTESGGAVAEGMRIGYKGLFDMNEKANELSDNDLKGLIVQATGLERNNRTVQAIVGSFKTLKDRANFETASVTPKQVPELPALPPKPNSAVNDGPTVGMNLSYTINLNLPATSDIAVFDAIFKSLKEHLLRQ